MRKALREQLHKLCGRVERLQFRLSRNRDKSSEDRREYEAVAKAKDALLDAIKIADSR